MGANATLAWLAGKRTPAIDAVARAGIAFTVHEYEHDPRAPSFGLEAVEKLGLDPARVYKTLVADVDGSLTVAVVPVEAQLDLRALGKRVRMADPRAAERATGYVTGGISPLGHRRRLPTIVDESALAFETIHVSAGRRGLELELTPADLVRLAEAGVAPIAQGKGQ
jgi:Cys-tRNA(Pro)/Cys-tRNA(Cys) deacylase